MGLWHGRQWRLAAGLLAMAGLTSPAAAQDLASLRRELAEVERQMQAQVQKVKALQACIEDLARSSGPARRAGAADCHAHNKPERATTRRPVPQPPAAAAPPPSEVSASTPAAAARIGGVPVALDAQRGLQLGHDEGSALRVGANFDLLAAYRNFGPRSEQRQLIAREVELSVEAQITPWLYGFVFLTRPEGGSLTLEEAAATAQLPWDIWLKAGRYRVEFGWLNMVHESERPQISLPLPIVEFFGPEQIREGAVTVGKRFDLGNGHKVGLSAAVWNGDSDVVFAGNESLAKPVAAKLEYGYERPGFALQTGLSGFNGAADASGRLASRAAAAHFNFFIDPAYNAGFDYPARFSLFSELIFNQRQIGTVDPVTGDAGRLTNNAVGGWLVADYQFLRSHHIGGGFEYTQGLFDRTRTATAYSAHYSWYYTPHSRLQLQARRVDQDPDEFGVNRRGYELILQWNVVLGPHSERPFIPVLSSH